MAFTSLFLNLIICLLLLIYQFKENKTVIYAVALILLANIRQIMMMQLNQLTNNWVFAVLLINFDPFIILIGPILLLYFKSLVQGKFIFEKWFWFYLIPCSIIFINTLPYFLQDFESKIQYVKSIHNYFDSEMKIPGGTLLFDYNIQMKITPIHNWSMIAYSMYYLYQQKKMNLIKSRNSSFFTRLVLIIILVMTPMVLQIILATLHAPNKYDLSFHDSTISYDLLYLASLILPLSFFLYPSWLYGSKTSTPIGKKLKEIWSAILRITTEEEKEKPLKSEDIERIVHYIETKKPYLKVDFSIHDVSRELNIPQLRVSNCFNKQLETTFPDFRNRLRIEYAINLFQENAHYQMSIEGVALQSGFKTKSAFYAAFRIVHGMTPTEWITKNL
jgi:AraC-like DNA-binding protein